MAPLAGTVAPLAGTGGPLAAALRPTRFEADLPAAAGRRGPAGEIARITGRRAG